MEDNLKKSPYSEATIALLDFIVRPPRFTSYTETDLGAKEGKVDGKNYIREDLDIINDKGLKMKCSFYYLSDSVSLVLF